MDLMPCRHQTNDTWVSAAPRSNHPGGVNGAFADGSIRFVNQNINTGNLASPQVVSGNSPYGVWGALGSIGGKEAGGDF